MKVKELRRLLNNPEIKDNMKVILSSDPEGNSYREAHVLDTALCADEGYGSYVLYDAAELKEMKAEGEDVPKTKEHVVVW